MQMDKNWHTDESVWSLSFSARISRRINKKTKKKNSAFTTGNAFEKIYIYILELVQGGVIVKTPFFLEYLARHACMFCFFLNPSFII